MSVKVRCFKMYAGHILIAKAEEVTDVIPATRLGEHGKQVSGYLLTHIRMLSIQQNPTNPTNLMIRIMPYVFGAADPRGLDETPLKLDEDKFHLSYAPEQPLESAYLQDVSGLVIPTAHNQH